MAVASDSTTAPTFQLRLLRGARAPGDGANPDIGLADRCSMPPVSSFELPRSGELNNPDEIGLAAAHKLYSRRALARAAEHGVALLAFLGLPRLVEPDFIPLNPTAIGDALDVVIAHLDALDAPAEDLEPYLAGHYNGMIDPGGEREDEPEHDEDDDPAEAEPDKEPSIGWPNDVQAVLEHRFEATDYDVEAVNEDGDDCGEAHAPWWDRIGHPSMEMFHV